MAMNPETNKLEPLLELPGGLVRPDGSIEELETR